MAAGEKALSLSQCKGSQDLITIIYGKDMEPGVFSPQSGASILSCNSTQ